MVGEVEGTTKHIAGRITMTKNYSEVVVTNIRMPFSSMVIFMVKWAIATIPALIILSIVGSLVFSLFGAILGGLHHRMGV